MNIGQIGEILHGFKVEKQFRETGMNASSSGGCIGYLPSAMAKYARSLAPWTLLSARDVSIYCYKNNKTLCSDVLI